MLLLEIGRLKMYSDQALVEKISQNNRYIDITFSADAADQIPIQRFLKLYKIFL